MPIEPEKKFKRGDKLVIQASTWNSLIDMLRWYKRHRSKLNGKTITDTIDPHNTILVQNQTGLDLDSGFKVLRIQEPSYLIQNDTYQFAHRPAVNGYTPLTIDDPIAITLMPGLSDYLIRSVVSGVTIAFVKMSAGTDEWCNPTPGTTDYLTSTSLPGQARILYWEPIDTGSGSGESGGSSSSDLVIAIVNLIGAISKSSTKFSRDNYSAGCASWSTPTYAITNANTYPGNTSQTVNRKIIWIADSLGSTYGPMCYIPAGSGRVVINAGIKITASIVPSFAGFQNATGQGYGLMMDFNFDLVNVDSNGGLRSINLYDETGLNAEAYQDATATVGLTDPIPILTGQVYNFSNHEVFFGNYNGTNTNLFEAHKIHRCSFYIANEPVRLAFRVNPIVGYNLFATNGTSGSTVVNWKVEFIPHANPAGRATFIDYLKVEKDRNWCDSPIDTYGS